MGNCGSSNAVVDGNGNKKKSTKAFQGTGHRLGAANETQAPASTSQTANDVDDTLPPRKDPNISDSDRDKQREARLAAAEARQKKMGGPPKKEKKTTGPLRGPNTEYTMTWQAG